MEMTPAEAFIDSFGYLGLRPFFVKSPKHHVIVLEDDHVETFALAYPKSNATVLGRSEALEATLPSQAEIFSLIIRDRKRFLRVLGEHVAPIKVTDMIVETVAIRSLGIPAFVEKDIKQERPRIPASDDNKPIILLGSSGGEISYLGRKLEAAKLVISRLYFHGFHLALKRAGGTFPLADYLREIFRLFGEDGRIGFIMHQGDILDAIERGFITPARLTGLINRFKIPVVNYGMRDKISQVVLALAERSYGPEGVRQHMFGKTQKRVPRKLEPYELLEKLSETARKEGEIRKVTEKLNRVVVVMHEDFITAPDQVIQRVEDLLGTRAKSRLKLNWEAEIEVLRPNFRKIVLQSVRDTVDALGLYANAQGSLTTLQDIVRQMNEDQLGDG